MDRKQLLNPRAVRLTELSLSIALSLAWLVYHLRFFLHAGALWRDEVNSVDLANSPTLSDIWQNLEDDSFPLFWHLFLRLWIRIGIGSSDMGLRLFGLLCGLAILSILWLNARRFRFGPPIFALAFLGFSASMICYGDSIRGYGLGILLGLITFGLIWDLALRPTPLRFLATFLVGFAAVHALFYNCVILAAVGAGAIVVTALHRQWNRAGLIALIGIVCATSMFIYVPIIHRRDVFNMMFFHETSPASVLSSFKDAMGYDSGNQVGLHSRNAIVWGIAVALSLLIGIVTLAADRRLLTDPSRRDKLVYHLVALLAGIVGYWLFFVRLKYVLQPWYFLPLISLVAVCIDGLIACASSMSLRIALCLTAACFCVAAAYPLWTDTGLRKTNVDEISRTLAKSSRAGDIVIISPWYFGITLQRYLNGPADLVPVPLIHFLAYHKPALVVPATGHKNALQPDLDRIEQTLRAGHTVYMLGQYSDLGLFKKQSTASPIPIPNNFFAAWSQEVEQFAARHTETAQKLDTQTAGVSSYEQPELLVFKGWKDPP